MPAKIIKATTRNLFLVLFSMIDKISLDKIDNAETIHQLLDGSVQKHALNLLEDTFHLVEYIINLRQGLFELMGWMLLLDIVKGTLYIHYLKLYYMHYLFMLVTQRYVLVLAVE